MKIFFFSILLSIFLFGCASNRGADGDFSSTATKLAIKKSGKKIAAGDYVLRLQGISRKVQNGSVSQRGTISKDGEEILDVIFLNDTKKAGGFSIELGGKRISFAESNFQDVQNAENGARIFIEPSDNRIKISVNSKPYAAIDYIHRNAKITLDGDFHDFLREVEEEYIFSLMLCVFHFETSFKAESASIAGANEADGWTNLAGFLSAILAP